MSREEAPEFLFENVGSRGDVVPLLSIAAELARRGRRCVLLANESYGPEATAAGVGFFSSWARGVAEGAPGDKWAHIYRPFEPVHDYFQRAGAHDARTVVVNTDVWAASEPLAEALGLRTVRLNLFPIRIRSLLSPPWPLGARATGPGGEHFLKVQLPAMHRAADRHPQVLAKVNGARARVGLPAVALATFARPHVVAQPAMFPEWYGMPAADWPELEFLGFPLPPCTTPVPQRLLDFLARVPRPLVFTPGTGCAQPAAFFAAAADCCARLGLPGIFLSRFYRPGQLPPGALIEHFDHIELEAVLRHAALLVHHGGMGTTARALQAGIPQVISPVYFDQPDNGHRVEVLGAGRVVPRAQLDGETLARAVRELLVDAELAARLAGYRAAIAATQGVQRCADLLENVAAGATARPARHVAAS